ncbi:MAG: hypothetical protein DRJ07_16130, partial [Bacteroidetes bacterium]
MAGKPFPAHWVLEMQELLFSGESKIIYLPKKLKTMKKITTLLLIAIFIFAFQSCKKAEETTPGGDNTPTQEEYVSCKIDGVDFL